MKVVADTEMIKLIKEVADAKRKKSEYEKIVKKGEEEIKKFMLSVDGVTYSDMVVDTNGESLANLKLTEKHILDTKKIKDKYPEIAEECMTTSVSKSLTYFV